MVAVQGGGLRHEAQNRSVNASEIDVKDFRSIAGLAEQIIAQCGESASARVASGSMFLSPREAMAWLPMVDDATLPERRRRFHALRDATPGLRIRIVDRIARVHIDDWRAVCAAERKRLKTDGANGDGW